MILTGLKKKLIFEWSNPLGSKSSPYAYRWRADFYLFSFRLHKWVCSDDVRAYHSHPVNMIVFILKGWYIDRYIKDGIEDSTYYERGDVRIIRRNYRHYVEIMQKPTWTLIFTWGAPKRWSFWLKGSLKQKRRDRYFIEHGNHICDR